MGRTSRMYEMTQAALKQYQKSGSPGLSEVMKRITDIETRLDALEAKPKGKSKERDD